MDLLCLGLFTSAVILAGWVTVYSPVHITGKQNIDMNCDKGLETGTERDSFALLLDERVRNIHMYGPLWVMISKVAEPEAV